MKMYGKNTVRKVLIISETNTNYFTVILCKVIKTCISHIQITFTLSNQGTYNKYPSTLKVWTQTRCTLKSWLKHPLNYKHNFVSEAM